LQSADQSLLLVGHVIGHLDALVDGVGNDSQRIKSDAQALAQAIMERFGVAKRGIAASPKALRVAKVLLGIAIKYRLEIGRHAAAGSDSRHQERMTALHESAAKTLRELCIETRGTFLKLGQFLSMRPDLLPPAYIEQLGTLRNQVPALPYALIEEVVESDLGGPVATHFERVDTEAVAAASLAQVHRAWGLDGQAYALKVQVPGAADQIGADIAILRAVAYALSETSLPFDASAVLDQLATSVHEELDYQTEAEHCQAIGAILAEQPGMHAPEVVASLSKGRVLTMTWMEGRTMDVVLKDASKDDRKQILTTLVESYCDQIFRHGYFQADPHAGNILVQDNLDLVMLDFGCAAVLSDEVRIAYADLMKALFVGDQAALREQLALLGFRSDCDDPAALENLALVMLDMLKREGAMKEWADDPQAASRLLLEATQSVPGLVTPRHFVLLGRVLATLGGLLIENADADVGLPAILAKTLMTSR
jgi:predicted unusual protein kinase regulating ubiquinone biosynthesis (AarF/ABC1/UbiB family)